MRQTNRFVSLSIVILIAAALCGGSEAQRSASAELSPASAKAVDFSGYYVLYHDSGTASAQEREDKTLDPALVPLEAARVEEFAPPGWKIHRQAGGDLNGDGRPDAALILFDKSLDDATPRSIENPQPSLVIALATEQGRWRRAGINSKLIVSDDSYFAPLKLQINKGVVILRQELQSNISANPLDYAYTHRFRYDSAADRFLLIGEDNANTFRGAVDDGIRVSDNYLTGERVITIMHAVRGKYVRETNTLRRIDKKTIFLEEARMQDLDFDTLMDEVKRHGSKNVRIETRCAVNSDFTNTWVKRKGMWQCFVA